MPKNILQDIVKIKTVKPPSLNSLKNIPPGEKQEKNPRSFRALWFIALISIVFLFFALSYLFSSAVITINPKTKDFILDKTLTATKDKNGNGLPYDLVVLSGEESKEVAGGPEQDYLESATGTVLIYNAFSTGAQPLSQDTRLEGSNGKIYKTKTKIIIPGMEKNGTPGKIEVDIYGEKAGPEYNSPPLDFKVLGFKGTSKYSKIYARSVGDITGGMKGLSSQVSDSDKAKITKELSDTLFAKLFEKAKNQTPASFALLKNAAFFNIDQENINPAPTPDSFIVDLKGTFNGILFNKEELTKEVINESLAQDSNADTTTDTTNTTSTSSTPSTTNPDVYVSNIEDLSISSFDKSQITLGGMQDIAFNLSGTAKLVWKIDADKLTADLLGRDKSDFNQVLAQYPNVDSASFEIKPVWRNSFPDKSARVKVIVNYPK